MTASWRNIALVIILQFLIADSQPSNCRLVYNCCQRSTNGVCKSWCDEPIEICPEVGDAVTDDGVTVPINETLLITVPCNGGDKLYDKNKKCRQKFDSIAISM
jgi:hypothetical protein